MTDLSADDAQLNVIRENVRAAGSGTAPQPKEPMMNMSFSVSPAEHDWLENEAKRVGVSMSRLCRAIVIAYRIDRENERER